MRLRAEDPIEYLELSVRPHNALMRASIKTVGEVARLLHDGELSDVRNFGEKSEREVRNALEEAGYVYDPVARGGRETGRTPVRVQEVDAPSAAQSIAAWHREIINRQISAGLLHSQARIGGVTIGDWVSSLGEVDSEVSLRTLCHIACGSLNVCEELAHLLARASRPEWTRILVSRHGLKKKTLAATGSIIGLTRERVRQVEGQLERSLRQEIVRLMGTSPPDVIRGAGLLRVKTAILVGRDMGLQVSYTRWATEMQVSGLLGRWASPRYEAFDPVEVLVSLLRVAADTQIQELRVPTNLEYALKLAASGSPEAPARFVQLRENLPKQTRRLVRSHACHTGAVNSLWLAQTVGTSADEMQKVLAALRFFPAAPPWFVPPVFGEEHDLASRRGFHRTVRRMIRFCGSQSTDSICSGLRHSVSRTEYPVPPPEVVEQLLEACGCVKVDGCWVCEGKTDDRLFRSESVIAACLDRHGPVVHHSELAEAFLASDLSFPSLHRTLQSSPLFEKIDTALYKWRGSSVNGDDIRRAEAAAETVPVEPEVSYDRRGYTTISANLSALAVGTGTLVSAKFRDLSGEWDCRVAGRSTGSLRAVGSEFRHLGKPFEVLGCTAHDRVKLVFDMWHRTVTVEKAG